MSVCLFRRLKVSSMLGLAGLAGCLFLSPAYSMDFDYSGFASVVTGITRGNCTPDNTMSSAYSSGCTRFIADWAHGGVYSSKLSAKPESKLGLQGSVRLFEDLSATAQVVGRFADHTTASLEWAYLFFPGAYAPVGWKAQSVSLRYDIGVSSAIKLQLDRFREDKDPFAGNSDVISASYDFIF